MNIKPTHITLAVVSLMVILFGTGMVSIYF